MPFDGNGTYNPPAPEYPAVSNTIIHASDFNTIISDLAAALSKCITTDGQSGITANIDFGGNRILHIAPGITPTDAVNMLQAFTDPTFTATTVNGVQVTGTMFKVSVTLADFTASQLVVVTQAAGDNSTKAASTAFVTGAINTLDGNLTAALNAEITNRTNADLLKAPLASPALTGVPSAPTASPGTNTTQLATCQFVLQEALSNGLPNQAGNAGRYLQTNGSTASWEEPVKTGDLLYTNRVPSVPEYLPCDGSSFVTSSYPNLIAELFSGTPGTPPSKYSNPDVNPPGAGTGVASSSDGTYFAVACATTPFLTIYKRTGDTITKLSTPASALAAAATSCAFSPDGQFLAVGCTASPFLYTYQRSGDTFNLLTAPATLPTGAVQSVAFSSDSAFLATGHAITPFISIYSISGTTFTKVANPATLPTAQINSVAFSTSTTYLAVAGAAGGSFYTAVYKRSGSVFTKLTDPPGQVGNAVAGITFSPDDVYLTQVHSTTPFTACWKRSGDTFTKLTTVPTLPGLCTGLAYSADGKYIYYGGSNNVPYFYIGAQDGDIIRLCQSPTNIAANQGSIKGVGASATGGYIILGLASSPNVQFYRHGVNQPEFRTPTVAALGTAAEIKGYIKS